MRLWVVIIESDTAPPRAYGPFESEVVAMRLATAYIGANTRPIQVYELNRP